MPQISIIVPVYKAEKTIRKCVNSILNQTFSDFELLLINDGSPDNSGAICDEIATTDPRIKVIHQENRGVSAARNAGLDAARGKYLMFCDSDDYVLENWCEHLYRIMEQGSIHLAACDVELLLDGAEPSIKEETPCKIIPREEFVNMASHISLFEVWNKIFIKDVIDAHHLRFDENLSRCEDAMFVLRYLQLIGKNDRLCYGSPVLYFYCVESTQSSLSKKYSTDYWDIQKMVFSQMRLLFDMYGIPSEESNGYLSYRTALALSGALPAVGCSRGLSFLDKFRNLRAIIGAEEYEIALRYGGMERICSPSYMKVLRSKSPLLIYTYIKLSSMIRR